MSSPAVGPAASNVLGTSLFGRKYSLTVSTPASSGGTKVITLSDSSFEPEALRITFDVQMPAIHEAYWYADIDVYNLDQDLTQEIISATGNLTQGMTVTLSAGYLNGNYNTVFVGPVFQALWSRPNVTDFDLKLHCILSLESAISGNIINANFAGGVLQTEVILNMLNNIGLTKDYISPKLNPNPLPRGKVTFGDPAQFFTQIAESNNMLWFLSQRGLSMGNPNDGLTSDTPAITYTPAPQGQLIGTPQQTQLGVDFTVLLDPRLQSQLPLMSVKLDQTIVQQYAQSVGERILPMDVNGIYVVGNVRHRGDSRGTLWETDVVGYTKIGSALAITGNGNIIH